VEKNRGLDMNPCSYSYLIFDKCVKASKCMELENINLSEAIQAQKNKSHMFPSYVDYRPKTNAEILWDMHHTKGRTHMGDIGQGKETKNLNVIDVLTI
jgi:hypothetical protein